MNEDKILTFRLDKDIVMHRCDIKNIESAIIKSFSLDLSPKKDDRYAIYNPTDLAFI